MRFFRLTQTILKEATQAVGNTVFVQLPAKKPKQKKNDDIWEVGDEKDRQRIREFWVSLGQEERKALVKLEKDAILKRMKEQQKLTCSCSVCGRKRSTIEAQLETLYNTYYEELENFAKIQMGSNDFYALHPHRFKTPKKLPPLIDDSDDDIDGMYDDIDEESESESESDDGMIEFGTSLTVKGFVDSSGGILTVADDILKNDGQRFLDLMEQLAHRKIRPLRDDEYNSPSDEWDDYDDMSEDEAEPDHISEIERMIEGRKMFQVFAARMFEQRVLNAYREKAAADRAAKLVEELDQEENEKKAKELARQKTMEIARERQKLLKQKKLDEKIAAEKRKKQEEEERNRKRQEEMIREAQQKEAARLAELERIEAEEKEQERQRKLAEERRLKKEEKIRQKQLLKQEEERKRIEAEAKKREQEEQLKKEREERKRLQDIRKKEEKEKRREQRRLEEERLKQEADRLKKEESERLKQEEQERKKLEKEAAQKKKELERQEKLKRDEQERLHQLELEKQRTAQMAEAKQKESRIEPVADFADDPFLPFDNRSPRFKSLAPNFETSQLFGDEHYRNPKESSPLFQAPQNYIMENDMTASVRMFFQNAATGIPSNQMNSAFTHDRAPSMGRETSKLGVPLEDTSKLGVPLQPLDAKKEVINLFQQIGSPSSSSFDPAREAFNRASLNQAKWNTRGFEPNSYQPTYDRYEQNSVPSLSNDFRGMRIKEKEDSWNRANAMPPGFNTANNMGRFEGSREGMHRPDQSMHHANSRFAAPVRSSPTFDSFKETSSPNAPYGSVPTGSMPYQSDSFGYSNSPSGFNSARPNPSSFPNRFTSPHPEQQYSNQRYVNQNQNFNSPMTGNFQSMQNPPGFNTANQGFHQMNQRYDVSWNEQRRMATGPPGISMSRVPSDFNNF